MRMGEDSKRLVGMVSAGLALCLMAAPGMAQTTGVSHPPTGPIVDTDDLPAATPTAAKPSPYVPMTGAATTAPAQLPAS